MKRNQFARFCLVGFAVVAAILLSTSTLSWVQAASILVNTTQDELNSDGDCSLREALEAANTDTAVDACPAGSGTDIITLPAGTYSLPLGALSIASNLTLDGAGAASTSIENAVERVCDFNGCHGGDRVVYVARGAISTITGVSIQNGNPRGDGGGILNDGTLTLTNSVVTNNTADATTCFCGGDVGEVGGGIRNNGTLTLTDTTVSNNTAVGNAPGHAGGIYNAGTANLSKSTVTGNRALGGLANIPIGGFGGGILNLGGLSLDNSAVTNNVASSEGGDGSAGGGIYTDGVTTLTNSYVAGNSTTASGTFPGGFNGLGGGIFVAAGALNIRSGTISGNSAIVSGGGIAAWAGTVNLVNVTVSGNSAANDGGGLYNAAGDTPGVSVALNNVTVADNTADADRDGNGNGGGLYNDANAIIYIANTLVGRNADTGSEAADCAGVLTSQGYNLMQSVVGCTVSGDATGNKLGSNPLLGPLQNNGGPTLTHALLPGSPAIDTGNPAPAGGGGNACAADDQRGVPRPQDGNGDGIARCDIGAFEVEGPSVSKVQVDIKPGSSTNPINLKSKGVIPVAILSTASLDATEIDPGTVCFGDAENPNQRDCNEAHGKGHVEDVNKDGRLDLVLHFNTEQTGIDAGDTQACLNGRTRQGLAVQGCDNISPVP